MSKWLTFIEAKDSLDDLLKQWETRKEDKALWVRLFHEANRQNARLLFVCRMKDSFFIKKVSASGVKATRLKDGENVSLSFDELFSKYKPKALVAR